MLQTYGMPMSDLLGLFYFCISLVLYIVGGVFNKPIFPLVHVECEMIIANSALQASVAIYQLISNRHSWNNCSIYNSE